MVETRPSRKGNGLYVVWCLVVCPIIGFLAVVPTHGEGSLELFIFLFCGLPAGAAFIVGVFTRRPPALFVGLPLVTAFLGVGVWAFIIMMAARSGIYDT